ncbi:MAG: DUF1566 domain-containing protein [Spirochaetaceae bacterium]|nr:DUF1566 domain-containing protein [Spirochaetaceae bacterium]MBQ8385547.1 DUF1566 domain-containing protein [Spirochaetaceae bacterium]MBR2361155.1 DUF1566 domain-containing protein [Spirochaetaceae bacterium]
MKKAALILTILFLALSLSAQDNTKQYKIGDTGPAGGIIFEVVGNKVWECSEIIGHLPWDKAFKFCPTYNGGGYDDWYLPTKDELESLYYNLIKPGLIHDKETYWSANQEESMALWGYNFKKGRPGLYGAAKKLAVRAVRLFEM